MKAVEETERQQVLLYIIVLYCIVLYCIMYICIWRSFQIIFQQTKLFEITTWSWFSDSRSELILKRARPDVYL